MLQVQTAGGTRCRGRRKVIWCDTPASGAKPVLRIWCIYSHALLTLISAHMVHACICSKVYLSTRKDNIFVREVRKCLYGVERGIYDTIFSKTGTKEERRETGSHIRGHFVHQVLMHPRYHMPDKIQNLWKENNRQLAGNARGTARMRLKSGTSELLIQSIQRSPFPLESSSKSEMSDKKIPPVVL